MAIFHCYVSSPEGNEQRICSAVLERNSKRVLEGEVEKQGFAAADVHHILVFVVQNRTKKKPDWLESTLALLISHIYTYMYIYIYYR